jgi:hypothetical protein
LYFNKKYFIINIMIIEIVDVYNEIQNVEHQSLAPLESAREDDKNERRKWSAAYVLGRRVLAIAGLDDENTAACFASFVVCANAIDDLIDNEADEANEDDNQLFLNACQLALLGGDQNVYSGPKGRLVNYAATISATYLEQIKNASDDIELLHKTVREQNTNKTMNDAQENSDRMAGLLLGMVLSLAGQKDNNEALYRSLFLIGAAVQRIDNFTDLGEDTEQGTTTPETMRAQNGMPVFVVGMKAYIEAFRLLREASRTDLKKQQKKELLPLAMLLVLRHTTVPRVFHNFRGLINK